MRPLILLCLVSVFAGCGNKVEFGETSVSESLPPDTQQAQPKSNAASPASASPASLSATNQATTSELADLENAAVIDVSQITQTSHEQDAAPKTNPLAKPSADPSKKPAETEVIED